MEIENKIAYLLPEERARYNTYAISIMKNVYSWMFLGLTATGLMALLVSNSYNLLSFIYSNGVVFWGMLIAELALVWILSARIGKMSFNATTAMFFVYSLLNGATMASIFVVYDIASIAQVFFITAGTFGATSLLGYFTNKDLSSWGNILLMALIGVVIASVVNLFIGSDTLEWIVSFIAVGLFVGLTAYDTQKIKNCLINDNGGLEDDMRKVALLGALSLYLDFINLFLALIRLLGKKN